MVVDPVPVGVEDCWELVATADVVVDTVWLVVEEPDNSELVVDVP